MRQNVGNAPLARDASVPTQIANRLPECHAYMLHPRLWLATKAASTSGTPQPTQTPSGRSNPLPTDLRALQGVLREEEIHVISDAIAKLMADDPHTI
jgi:hypothetical protein